VTGQASRIEVQATMFRQTDRFEQQGQSERVWPIRSKHEFVELKVKSHDVCTERFHLVKIASESLPVVLPKILHQPAVMSIVQAPGMKTSSRELLHKAVFVRRNDDTLGAVS